MQAVERYLLDIVGLTSTHNLDSGTQFLERAWTLYFSGAARSVRWWAGVGLLIAPQLSSCVLEFNPVNERVTSLCLRVGDSSLTVISAYGPISTDEYLALFESLGGVLDGAQTGDCCSSTPTLATTVRSLGSVAAAICKPSGGHQK